MKIVVMLTGATREGWLAEGERKYADRLRHYLPFDFLVLPDLKQTKGMQPSRCKELEGERMLSCLEPTDFVALLDERGREMTSRELSQWLANKMQCVAKRMVLIIGGPFGFSDAVYARADAKISLSRLTFTHEMARVVLTEQLYRAMTIIRGESYHHD